MVSGDGHAGLTAAIRTVFPSAIRQNCFFHVLQKIRRYVYEQRRLLPQELTSALLLDLKNVRNGPSPYEFKLLAIAMLRKWSDHVEVCEYLIDNVFPTGLLSLDNHLNNNDESKGNWYVSSCGPVGHWLGTTNNCIESFNRAFKLNITDYHNLALKALVEQLRGSGLEAISRSYRLPGPTDVDDEASKGKVFSRYTSISCAPNE